DDVCDRLNSAGDCMPWQCDAASHRCVRRLRDDDRDGDPAGGCGGGDCDDHDPAVSSLHAEVCDGKDNDCDQLVDEDVVGPGAALPSLAAFSAPHTVLVAWYDVDLGARESPIQSCASAAPAELRAVVLTGMGAGLRPVAPPRALLTGGIAVRPAALVALGNRV